MQPKQRTILQKAILDILSNKIAEYDVKPLKGYKSFYRLRKGQIRIIFVKKDTGIFIYNIGYRKDSYKNLP